MSETRRAALRASYLCGALAAGLLALHFNLGWLPQWTRGISLLSGGVALADYGINDDFIKEIGKSLERGKSAIFMLVRRVNTDKALPELAKFGGRILRTSLSNEQEARLKRALEELQEREAVLV